MERSLIAEYEHLHSSRIYGTGGRHFPYMLPHVLAIRPNSIVDYGAGNSNIAAWIAKRAAIKGRVVMYDPAVPGRAEKPVDRFDLLVSFDVLEHIPEEELDAVLAEMASMADHFLHVIDIRPAKAILSDGRNAHVSLHSPDWWQERLSRFMPGVRRIPRDNRAAFKTWSAELPPWRSAFVERRERTLRWGARKLGLTGAERRSKL